MTVCFGIKTGLKEGFHRKQARCFGATCAGLKRSMSKHGDGMGQRMGILGTATVIIPAITKINRVSRLDASTRI